VIDGAHVMIYTEDAEADRAFFRDVLRLPFSDTGHGWLIFALPPSEAAFHPVGGAGGGHELYLMCADLTATMAELTGRGAEFSRGVAQEQWGTVTAIRLPGGGELGLYEPRHTRAEEAVDPQG
jgi:catechol 2,3-dioxygenase-like lactoylglutathione lyase family enzyme